MSLSARKAAFLVLTLAVLTSTRAAAQNPAGSAAPQDSAPKPSGVSAPSDKAELLDATRVSTDDAARRAAQEKAGQPAAKPSKRKEEAGKEAPARVTELQPSRKEQREAATVETAPEDPGKSPLKKIHGSVQGRTGSGVRQGGAEVGASSKSGRTHVYVETERSRTDPATPH